MSHAYMLYVLLDIYKHLDSDTTLDIEAALKLGLKQGLLTKEQICIVCMFTAGYSLGYLTLHYDNAGEKLGSALNVLSELTDFKDSTFKHIYCKSYSIDENLLDSMLEKLSSNYDLIEEIT